MAALALHKIFVYGTLKRGESNHYLFESAQNGIARLLGPAKLAKKHPMILTKCGIPVVSGGNRDLYDIIITSLPVLM